MELYKKSHGAFLLEKREKSRIKNPAGKAAGILYQD